LRRGRKELQIKKNSMVALSNKPVSERLEALGNFIRRKRSKPNSAIRTKLNHASCVESIRLDHDRPELKKSQTKGEEFMKIAIAPMHRYFIYLRGPIYGQGVGRYAARVSHILDKISARAIRASDNFKMSQSARVVPANSIGNQRNRS
jgi:hypothetical protein